MIGLKLSLTERSNDFIVVIGVYLFSGSPETPRCDGGGSRDHDLSGIEKSVYHFDNCETHYIYNLDKEQEEQSSAGSPT